MLSLTRASNYIYIRQEVTCVYVYICMCVCVFVHMYVRVYVCLYICMCVCTCVCVCMCVCTYVCVYEALLAPKEYTHIHIILAYTSTHIRACIYMHSTSSDFPPKAAPALTYFFLFSAVVKSSFPARYCRANDYCQFRDHKRRLRRATPCACGMHMCMYICGLYICMTYMYDMYVCMYVDHESKLKGAVACARYVYVCMYVCKKQ